LLCRARTKASNSAEVGDIGSDWLLDMRLPSLETQDLKLSACLKVQFGPLFCSLSRLSNVSRKLSMLYFGSERPLGGQPQYVCHGGPVATFTRFRDNRCLIEATRLGLGDCDHDLAFKKSDFLGPFFRSSAFITGVSCTEALNAKKNRSPMWGMSDGSFRSMTIAQVRCRRRYRNRPLPASVPRALRP
jgi:hypothetical protein